MLDTSGELDSLKSVARSNWNTPVGDLPHPRKHRRGTWLRRRPDSRPDGDRLQPQEQHRRQAVSAGHGIVEAVLLANDQRLVVRGRVEKAAMLPVGELTEDLIGHGDRLIEPRRRAAGFVERQQGIARPA